MRYLFAVTLLATLTGCGQRDDMHGSTLPENRAEVLRIAVSVPAGAHQTGSREPGCYTPERVSLPAFQIWPVEVPEAWWCAYRGEQTTPQDDRPVAEVTYHEAQAFCAWFSDRYTVTARLPTRHEWEAAARAGTAGVRYPWGWQPPEGRCAWAATGRSAVARFDANPIGLYDLAGSVAEWVAAPPDSDEAPVMGGSWAENDPRYLRISHRLFHPKTYRDRDVGFRLVIETN